MPFTGVVFINRLFLILALLCIFVGCANFPSATNNYRGKPEWITHPSGTTYIGGVGYSGAHIKGKAGQRELAIARAIDDIARQVEVKVDSVTSVKTMGTTGEDSFASMKIYSVQTVTGASFSAKITDVWEDASSGELYIYMRLMD